MQPAAQDLISLGIDGLQLTPGNAPTGNFQQSTWQKLQNYPDIGELHISANHGKGDIHQPITNETFGLDWIRDRTSGDRDLPVVLECYMHNLSSLERQEQVGLISSQ